MFVDSGEISTQAFARSSSAADKMVRNATPLAGVLAYWVLMECRVRSVYRLAVRRTSSIEMPVTNSGVPSRDPPSALMIAARSRGKSRRMPAWIDWTMGPTVLALLCVGRPTRMSTSPTLISWRRKSSVRKLSSANLFSVRGATERSSTDTPCVIVSTTYQSFRFASAETNKTDKGPWLEDRAAHPRGEKCSCQTSRSEYSLCTFADPARQLAPHSKGY